MANDIDRPRRNQVTYYEPPSPQQVSGDPVDRMLARFDARGRTKTLNALTQQAEAGTRYLNALTTGGRSLIAYLDVRAEIADLPAKYAHQAAVTLENRKAQFEEAVHRRKYAHMQWEKEAALMEADLLQARVVLTDAEQQLDAQRRFGDAGYELAWRRKAYETLGVELTADERRAIVAEYAPVPGSRVPAGRTPDADELDDALLEARNQLRSKGLDTTRIDELIARRGTR